MFQNWCLRVICFCALLTDTAVCTQTFYKLVSSADGASVTDQNVPFLTQSFFTCGSNEDCRKVPKFKRSRLSEVIPQTAIKEDAIVYEKVNTPKTDDSSWSEWHPMMCSATCGGGRRTLMRYCYSSFPCKGESSRLEESCNTESCPDLLNCTYNTTSFSDRNHFTDLQPGNNWNPPINQTPSCHGSDGGAIMTGLKLENNGSGIRYKYSCCKFKEPICQLSEKIGPKIDCGRLAFVSSFQRKEEINTLRYSYKCCELFHSRWVGRMRCIENATQYVGHNANSGYTLSNIPIQCPAGYGLSMLTLRRNAANNKRQFIFRCCHVAY